MTHTSEDSAPMPLAREKPPRPSTTAEVRAWGTVAVTMLVYLVGFVWWAAVLSTQNAAMRELLVEMRQEMKGYARKEDVDNRLLDHEQRLRELERRK